MKRHSARGIIAAFALAGILVFCMAIAMPGPGSAFERLDAIAFLLNGIPVVYLFLAFLLVLRRPIAATFLTAIVCLAVTFGNNFKVSIISQPVVASDFIVFGQVLENPVLFEKYFREQWYLVPALLVLLILPLWVIRRERPFAVRPHRAVVSVVLGGLLLWQMENLLLKPRAPLQRVYAAFMPPFDRHAPADSVARHGLFATLVNAAGSSYFELPPPDSHDEAMLTQLLAMRDPPGEAPETLPNLVVIVNEAFFDFRVLDEAFPADAYAEWDHLKRVSRFGLAGVDTYGGATLRTEFSLLTGIPASLFGAELDYPYLTVVTAPIAAIPAYLGNLGYETTAIHPFHAKFWRRDRAYPHLGFDTFLSLGDFANEDYDGPYVSDAAVCRKIEQRLASAGGPLFVFVVTMENHGPWSFVREQRGELGDTIGRAYDWPADAALQLERYLYHLRNAAAMASCVITAMEAADRPGSLLMLGDHAPAMPKIFENLGVPDPWREPALRTVPYLLWNSRDQASRREDTAVSALPAALFEAAGLPPDRYLAVSEKLRQNCNHPRARFLLPSGESACPDATEAALLLLARRKLRPVQAIDDGE